LIAFNGAGAATVHAFFVFGPEIDALRTGIALDHPIGVIVRMMSQSFNGDVVAGIDLHGGLEQLAKIAPVNGLSRGGEIMVVGSALARRHGLSRRR
jgi:hypothetical protein